MSDPATADGRGGRGGRGGSDSGDSGDSGHEVRRHHPAFLLHGLPRALWNFATGLALLLILRLVDGDQGADPARTPSTDDAWETDPAAAAEAFLAGLSAWAVAALLVGALLTVVLASVAIQHLRWRTETFERSESELILRRGVFVRTVRRLPIESVQSVILKRTLTHRLTGTALIVLDTSIEGEGEATLPTLARAEAEALAQSFAEQRTSPASAARSVDEDLLVRPSVARALAAGATGFRLGPLFVVGGVLASGVGDAALELVEPRLTDWLASDAASVGGWRGPAARAALIAVAAALLAWLLSIAAALNTLSRFELRYADGAFRKRYGLLEAASAVSQVGRIQLVRIDATPLRQALGLATVHDALPGEARAFGTAEAPLHPLAGAQEVGRVTALALPGIDVDALEWRPVSPSAFLRGVVRYGAPLALIGAAAVAAFGAPVAPTAAGALAVTLLLARWRRRSLGYAETDANLALRTGPLLRRVWIVPTTQIQGASVAQTPVQRRAGVATLTLHIAATGASRRPRVSDLPIETALRLQRRAVEAAAVADWWTPETPARR